MHMCTYTFSTYHLSVHTFVYRYFIAEQKDRNLVKNLLKKKILFCFINWTPDFFQIKYRI